MEKGRERERERKAGKEAKSDGACASGNKGRRAREERRVEKEN
jgi:hypothetical protein